MRSASTTRSPAPALFAALLLLVVLGPSAGCGATGPHGSTVVGGVGSCDPEKLDVCEAAIAGALEHGDDPTPLVRGWVAGRASHGDDALAKLLEEMEKSGAKGVLVRVAGAGAATPPLETVELAAEPKLERLSMGAVALALGKVSKASFIVVALPGGKLVRAYPRDPLSPVLGGLLPFAVTAERADLAVDLAGDLAIEQTMERAFDAGKAFDYTAASEAIDEIDAYTSAHDFYGIPALRARMLSSMMSLSAPISWSDSGSKGKPIAVPPEPTADDTPYVDLLRVRLDYHELEWPKRGARLLAAFPADKRPALEAMFSLKPACGAVMPPMIATERDLLFSGLLPQSLLPAHTRDPRGRLSLETWYPAYAAMVGTIDRTGTTFLYATRLTLERGQSARIVPNGLEAHRLAGTLAVKHAKALKKLASDRPGRVGFGQLGFLIAPGNMVDVDLRKEVLDLAQAAARGGLAGATDASDALLALLTGVLTGMQLPGELRDAHFGALQSVFTAKLRGDFAKRTGWGVATLFAIDGLYRVLFEQAPNVAATSAEIARALETDPSIAEPALATLVASFSRYAALASNGQLGAEIAKDTELKPDRAAAKKSLEKALAGLGGDGAAPDPFVRDVAELADGAIATVAISALGTPTTDKSKKTTCTKNEPTPLDPRAKNALAHLRDTRRTVFASNAWKSPATTRDKRLKLLVLVLSDVMDAVEANGEHKAPFAISDADARSIARDALAGWLPGAGLPDALVGGYMLGRGYFEHGTKFFDAAGTGDIRTMLAGLGTFFRGEEGDTIEGAVLLTMLLPKDGSMRSSDFMKALVDVASALYAADKSQQADMVLLGTVVLSSLREDPPSEEVRTLARERKSEVAWVLGFMRAVEEVRHARKADPAWFAPDLSKAISGHCGVANVEEIGGVIGAIDGFRSGKRKEARASLSALLETAHVKGFSTPRYSFSFKQETRSRALSLTLDIGLAQGLVTNTNSFNLGAGAKSDSEPILKLAQSVSSPDTKDSLDESARYYTRASALLAVYDFLDGDAAAGEIHAARTLGLLTQRSWLGVPGTTDEPIMWAKDSRGTLAILAVLASDSGRPLLAGDLLTVVKATLDPNETDETFERSLELPYGLGGMPDVTPIAERASKLVRRIAANLPCSKTKPPPSPDRATCAEYPLALALRVADVATVLPALSVGDRGKTGACPDLAALDGFLRPAQTRVYDPDKFVAAIDALLSAGKTYDASVLLTKHRREDHCSPSITDRVKALSDKMKGAPATRADLLTVIVNCSTGEAPAELGKTISALDDELLEMGDPQRSASLALFATGASLKLGSWEPLQAVALKPGFVARWQKGYPEAIAAALVLDHAATILHGDQVDLDATAQQFGFVCGGSPPQERAALCKTLNSLRIKQPPNDALKKAAKDALSSLVTQGP